MKNKQNHEGKGSGDLMFSVQEFWPMQGGPSIVNSRGDIIDILGVYLSFVKHYGVCYCWCALTRVPLLMPTT